MIDIVFKSQEPLKRGSQKFRMAKTISDILILILRFDCYIIFVSFGTEMLGNRPGLPLFLPLLNVLVVETVVERSVSYKSVLVSEGKHILVIDISAGEA